MSFRLLVEEWPEGTLSEEIVRHRLAAIREHPDLPAGNRGLLEATRQIQARESGRMNYRAAIFLGDLIRQLSGLLESPAPAELAEAVPAA